MEEAKAGRASGHMYGCVNVRGVMEDVQHRRRAATQRQEERVQQLLWGAP